MPTIVDITSQSSPDSKQVMEECGNSSHVQVFLQLQHDLPTLLGEQFNLIASYLAMMLILENGIWLDGKIYSRHRGLDKTVESLVEFYRNSVTGTGLAVKYSTVRKLDIPQMIKERDFWNRCYPTQPAYLKIVSRVAGDESLLAMPALGKESLQEALFRVKNNTLLLRLFLAMLYGVAALHAKGICHLDLHDENIRVTEVFPGIYKIYLIDFGRSENHSTFYMQADINACKKLIWKHLNADELEPNVQVLLAALLKQKEGTSIASLLAVIQFALAQKTTNVEEKKNMITGALMQPGLQQDNLALYQAIMMEKEQLDKTLSVAVVAVVRNRL